MSDSEAPLISSEAPRPGSKALQPEFGANHGKEKNGTQYKNDLCLTLGENIEK